MGDESVAARGIPYGCATEAVLVVEQAVDSNLVDAGFPGDVDNAAIKSVIGKLMYCGAENPFLRILRLSHVATLYQRIRLTNSTNCWGVDSALNAYALVRPTPN